MRVLVDTHAAVWFGENDAKLSAAARLSIEDPFPGPAGRHTAAGGQAEAGEAEPDVDSHGTIQGKN